VLLCLKTETELTLDMSCFCKKLDNKVQKNKILSVNCSNALFYILSTHHNFAMQALIWLSMVQFRAIRFGASYMNLV